MPSKLNSSLGRLREYPGLLGSPICLAFLSLLSRNLSKEFCVYSPLGSTLPITKLSVVPLYPALLNLCDSAVSAKERNYSKLCRNENLSVVLEGRSSI